MSEIRKLVQGESSVPEKVYGKIQAIPQSMIRATPVYDDDGVENEPIEMTIRINENSIGCWKDITVIKGMVVLYPGTCPKPNPFPEDLSNAFIFEIDTRRTSSGSSEDNQFRLPLVPGATDIHVFWGDGTSDEIASYNQVETIHTYTTAGEYEVIIFGAIQNWQYAAAKDLLKQGNILNWGGFNSLLTDVFYGCANISVIAEDIQWLNFITDASSYFRDANINTLPSSLKLDSLIDGFAMFANNNLTVLPELMKLSALESGNSMFTNNSLTVLPELMTLSTLESGNSMFKNNNLESLPENMALDLVTESNNMFELNQIDFLPEVMALPVLIDGKYMFSENNLTVLPELMTLPSLVRSERMFSGNSLTILPANMGLDSLLNGSNMFYTNSLTMLPAVMHLNGLLNGNGMFFGNNLTVLPSVMALTNLVTGTNMFYTNNLTTLPSGVILQNLTYASNMFLGNTIESARYTQLIQDLNNLNPNINVPFHGGNSKYNASAVPARNELTAAPKGWTITDGGLEP
ncbi:hypothetical protein [Brumimicrobium mesophilum]|uniref:hypothetical protein n=1 Tax=Brumimicrobium mesophilum TaxID=392717 RepID=UPI000D142290|nr:hypothetical protein [Brumimicrobium mesophilum]